MKKNTLIISFFLLMATSAMAALIPSGTKLYLDASKAWTGQQNFSVYFWSNKTDGNYVQMTQVPGENRMWVVTAPGNGKMWTNVIFRSNTSASGSGSGWGSNVQFQTADLVWDGSQSLYTVLCDNCSKNAGGTAVASGRWSSYIPMPTGDPSSIGTASSVKVCYERVGKDTILTPSVAGEYVNLQWFAYENGKWRRVGDHELSPKVTLPASKTATADYYFVGQRLYNGKIVNGDFSQGKTSFTTSYNYSSGTNCLWTEGNYTITGNVKDVHNNVKKDLFDHTKGDATGAMMAVNGGSTTGITIWQQTVTGLTPNTQYAFSAWVTNWDEKNENLARLEFSINGELQGGQFSPSGDQGHWTQLYTIWNSGSSTTATIKLINQQGAASGNDFAIDDISFSEMSYTTELYHVSYMDCSTPCPQVIINTPVDTTVCDTLLPIVWRGYTFTDEGSRVAIEQSPRGCDSIETTYTLHTTHCVRTIKHDIMEACIGTSTILTPTSVGETYLWNTGATTRTLDATPSAEGDVSYTCLVTIHQEPSLDKNIIANGGFEDVSTSCPYPGFTSDYECHSPTEKFDYNKSYRGFYKVDAGPSYGISPHSGNYMLNCDGDLNEKTAWSAYTTEALVQGRLYRFSFWAAMQGTVNPAQLTFYIEYNGKQDVLIPEVTLTKGAGWQQYGQDLSWTAPENCTQARVYLVDKCPKNDGNDFSLDDIIFQPLTADDLEVEEQFVVRGKDCDPCKGFITDTQFIDTATVCGNTLPITWHGHEFTKPDSISDTIPSLIGCGDSIIIWYRLDTIRCTGPCEGFTTDTIHIDTLTVCGNSLPITWHGYYFEKPDDYYDTIRSKIGCGDSIITWYRLDTIHCAGPCEGFQTQTVYIDTATVCGNTLPITWHGHEFTKPDTISDTIPSLIGCGDSIIIWYRLDTIRCTGPCEGFTTDTIHIDTLTVCGNSLPITWHGYYFEKPDDYYDTIRSKIGCGDSIITQYHLDTICCVGPCEGFQTQTYYKDTTVCDTLLPITWRGYTYTQPNSYYDTIRSKTGCGDSIITQYELKTTHCERPIPPTPPEPETCLEGLVYAKWTNFLFCDNGKFEFTAYQWYCNDVIISGQTKQYLYLESGMGQNQYVVEVTRTDGTQAKTCPLTFGEAPRSAGTYETTSSPRRVVVPLGTNNLIIVFDENNQPHKLLQKR